MLQNSHILDVFNYLYWINLLIAIVLMVSVILNNRNPIKTFAWMLVFVFLPVLGFVLYFFFGRDTRKRRLISRRSLSQIQKKSLLINRIQQQCEIPERQVSLARFFENIAQAYPLANNSTQIISDGMQLLHHLLKEIYLAKDHIHLQFYIFLDDSIGRIIRDALIDRANDGVEIRLLYDDVGCWSVNEAFFEEMRDAGIYVQSFLKVRFPLLTSKMNYRNHRKVVVIDGRVGFVGGMNIANRYVTGGQWGCWRDMQLLIKGGGVYGLQISFLVDWYFANFSLISGKRYFPMVEPRGCGCIMQIVTSNPIGQWHTMMRGMSLAFSQLHGYLYLQTPYFMPSEPVLSALQNAALSGVDVRLMVPVRSDNWITNLSTYSYLGDVMRAGVKVYLFEKGFLHSKMWVGDDIISSVGSTNLDFRSFEHNFEINAFVYDASLAKKMKIRFLEDMNDSKLFTMKEYMDRPFKQKLKESVARLFSPIL